MGKYCKHHINHNYFTFVRIIQTNQFIGKFNINKTMKKLSYLLGLIVITGMIFSSCEKDEDADTPPSVTFLGGVYEAWGIERTDGDVTMESSKPLVFGFSASSTSDKNLSRVLITRNYENVSLNTILDEELSVATYALDIETVSHPVEGTEVFEITVWDRNNLSTTISFTVTTTPADPGISIYNGISLGSYQSSTNSSFASVTGETFSFADAEDPAVQNKISWIYFHGNAYGHTIMSPANEDIYEIYPSVEEWTNKNTTFMAKTDLTVQDYVGITNKNQLIIVIQGSGASLTSDFHSELMSNPSGFEVGDIIAFETADGDQGLINVTQVNPGANNGLSTIKYDVKIEN